MKLDQAIQKMGLEYATGRFYGIYKGVTVENNDPNQQGRIKISVPELGRDDPLQHYAYPVSPYAGDSRGFFFPPEVGDLVWVMFEGGNPAFPVYLGGWWKNPSRSPSGSTIPVDARKTGEPQIREIRTKAGHRIIFDDSSSGGITIQTPSGNILRFKDTEGKIEIVATNTVSVKSKTVEINAAETVKVNASIASIQSGNVKVTGMAQFNNGAIPVAAIGDRVVCTGGITGTIVGSPVNRPLVT